MNKGKIGSRSFFFFSTGSQMLSAGDVGVFFDILAESRYVSRFPRGFPAFRCIGTV